MRWITKPKKDIKSRTIHRFLIIPRTIKEDTRFWEWAFIYQVKQTFSRSVGGIKLDIWKWVDREYVNCKQEMRK